MKLTVIYKDHQPTIDGLVHLSDHIPPNVRRVTISLTKEQESLLVKRTKSEGFHIVFFEEEE